MRANVSALCWETSDRSISSCCRAVTEEMDHLRCMLYIHGGAYYCEFQA